MRSDTGQLRLTHRRPAIGHEIVQSPLRMFWVQQIARFQHLAFVPHHLSDIDRIVPAVIGTVVVDTTDILALIG